MAESRDILELGNGKRRKITHSEPLFPTLVSFGAETLRDDDDEELEADDLTHFDPSDDEDSDGICPRLTTNRIFGEDHETAVQLAKDRYLRDGCDKSISDSISEFEAAKFEWAYAATEGPDFPPAPIWAIKATRGREWDVVCTILEIAQQLSHEDGILSACTTPAAPGVVYIECTSESVVRRLLSCIAFTRRPPPIQAGSWVRIGSTGQYKRDLAWVLRYEEETSSAFLYLLPRWRTNERVHGEPVTRTGLEQTFSSDEVQSYQALLPQHLNGPLDRAVHCYLYGQSFHFGFLLCRELLANLDIHHVNPSTQELSLWTESTMYNFAEHVVDRDRVDLNATRIAALFTRSLNQQLAAAKTPLPLQIGHRVRLAAEGGGFGSASGWVRSVNENSVHVIMYDKEGGNLVSAHWSAAQTILDLRVGNRVMVTKGPWGGLRARVTRVNLLEAEVEIACDAGNNEQLDGAEAPNSSQNVMHGLISRANKRRLSVAVPPRFSSITLPWGHVGVDSKSVMFQQAIDLASSDPSPDPRLNTKDPYIQMEVKAFDRNIGLFYGTILSTSADQSLVTVRTEGRAVNTIELVPVKNVKERHTELSLAEYVQMPRVKIRELRAHRENARSDVATNVQSDTFFGLPDACEAWPEVLSDSEPTTGSDLPSSTPGPSALEKCYLDVFVQGGTTKISAEYENRVGVIRSLEKVKRGKRGSVKIRFGRGLCTDRWIPVRNVFPLTTTEYEGVTTRTFAKSILDVMGIYVVIIGPDVNDRRTFIGRTGFTSWEGKINLDGALIVFPVTSLCRSDPVAK
ncbi:hypothetical protein R3P38DRAFT_2849367 [Favolaschia claudopus]|uniref:NGN domain-containing protein n=1 Tax=Favolaschia claudopus TaxID=2862362 RepID=A0AAW0DTR5_9AGAR